LAGINAARFLKGKNPIELPETTMIGALCYYVTHTSAADFQPMKANFGLLPPLVSEQVIRDKRKRYQAYAVRALEDLAAFLACRAG
jgi:methylenetetrahydrofolate--tRNA-(uracil-5-)-methyltransferase